MLKQKKMQRGFIDSSSSSKGAIFNNEGRLFKQKYDVLVPKYKNLVKGIETKKNKLEEEKQRKLTLSAEVRFLKRKYRELIRNRSLKVRTVKPELAQIQVPKMRKEANAKPNRSPILDLNQISIGEEEEGREFQFASEPLRVENYATKYPIGGIHEEPQPNDLKKSVCRNNGSGPNRSGKRKISWQDQVVLRV